MTERTDHSSDPADEVPVQHVHPPHAPEEETIDTPVLDGAEELQAEAAAAIESGDVDVTDASHGGPSVVEERATDD